jgi:predicted NBD/HSP70 family sugar kinase
MDAKAVFKAHRSGQTWASGLIRQSASAVAELCANLKAILDPDLILIGGGIGLAPGYLAMVKQHLQSEPGIFRVALEPAKLGVRAAFIGALTG